MHDSCGRVEPLLLKVARQPQVRVDPVSFVKLANKALKSVDREPIAVLEDGGA